MIIGIGRCVLSLFLSVGRHDAIFLIGVGFCAGLLSFSFVSKFTRVYIFGHEFTHWLTAKIFLRETSKFTLRKSGGSVLVRKPNIWIVLSPYFVPFYTVVWIIIIKIFAMLELEQASLNFALYIGIGFTYSYHVLMTTVVLLRHQPDLKLNGQILSLSFIILFNFAVLYFGILSLTNEYRLGGMILKDTFATQFDYSISLMYAANRILRESDFI